MVRALAVVCFVSSNCSPIEYRKDYQDTIRQLACISGILPTSYHVPMSRVRKAVILAAGMGTRLLPATKAVPKPMLPIVDKPLLQYAVEEAVASGETAIFFESPHRLTGTLELLASFSPEARVCVARELTKKFETYHRGSAAELAAHFTTHAPKGEIVLLLHGPA